ncbi:bacterial proteasome activator family protein [Actinotalea sp. BY-33]|uniref:Bacterial proteasome activator n=1 Tax=Actinotalea soli TaxID=2819234 RepID=A0A939RVV0_9CELL|nr:bacterial proteasome activator family protein [Actinotalea soli]MBO1751526.1 bacterial proteasome activator family protein [Actinotalea soli]
MSDQPVPPSDPADTPPAPAGSAEAVAAAADPTVVGQPAKVMRIGTMIKQLLEEVRSAPLDEAARGRLAEVHARSLRELEDGLSPDLVDELRRISLPFPEDSSPSEAELRIAQAQLVGWLEGLFHGLQAALVAQQMASQAQVGQRRRALPPGSMPGGLDGHGAGAGPGQAGPSHRADGAGREERHPGQYL